MHDGVVKIRIAAPPVENAANLALVGFVAAQLGIAKRSVRIVSGGASRRKVLEIDGVMEKAIAERLKGVEFGVRATLEAGSVLAHQDKRAPRVSVVCEARFARSLRQDVATDRWAAATETRKTDRSHASGPPMSGEGMDTRTARPTKNTRRRRTLRDLGA
jgi:hypothetical protein